MKRPTRRQILHWSTAGAALLAAGKAARGSIFGNRYYQGPPSDHFDGTYFFNPDGQEPAGFADLLRWQFGGGRASWSRDWESPHPPARPQERIDGRDLRVTMVGHATMLVQVAGLNILTDPVWSRRASPFPFVGPSRVTAPGIVFKDLPPIDLVLLTHNHYDHLDLETLRRLKEAHDPLVVTPLGNDTIIETDVPGMRFHVQDWGDAVVFGPVTIHCAPAHHWSARGLGDRRMALWASFVVETAAGNIYHIGDTGFHSGIDYRAARERHGGFRLALLPVGAYEPRWFMAAQHQNPAEAVEGMKLCGAGFAVGHHWGTFQLTNEPVEQPRDDLLAALEAAGVPRERFRPMLPGEVWDVPVPGAT